VAVHSTLNATNIIARSIRRGEVYLVLGKSSISLAILRVRANVSTTDSGLYLKNRRSVTSTYLLSEGLARAARVSHINGLPIKRESR
jgi:hypothetical protein